MPCKHRVSVQGECVDVATDKTSWQSICCMSDICTALQHCHDVTAVNVTAIPSCCAMSATVQSITVHSHRKDHESDTKYYYSMIQIKVNPFSTHTTQHNHFTALWTLSGTTQMSYLLDFLEPSSGFSGAK